MLLGAWFSWIHSSSEKLVFTPTKYMEYHSYIINSENITIWLSDGKKQNIRSSCTEILNEDFLVIRKVACILGKISSFSAVQF